MANRWRNWTMLVPAFGMLILILDSKTAVNGAMDGIDLCIRCVIPSLFPFLILSILLTNMIQGKPLQLLRPISKLCRIPRNGESLFLVGLLGGYPTGAQAISFAYSNGQLTKEAARRLLGFCSNAGPAFIFGITGSLFQKSWVPWILWCIHILSAIAVGATLPCDFDLDMPKIHSLRISVQDAFKKSVLTMSGICGWIVLFRVLITFSQKWFLFIFPESTAALFAGVLELTNGIFALQYVDSESARLILCATLLGFGGGCVMMQTASVTGELGTGWYFIGKVLQCIYSWILSIICAWCIYGPDGNSFVSFVIAVFSALCFVIVLHNRKFTVDFLSRLMYNNQKSLMELPICFSVKK